MSTEERRCVLVGTDGSWRSAAVLDVAAAEASARAAPLTVVSVTREVAEPSSSLTELLQDERRTAELADWRLREAVSRVRAAHPALTLTTLRVTDRDLGWPAEDAAALPDAELLVLGAHGGHAGPVFGLGTVSRHLLKSTSCPVLVVPDRVPEPAARAGAVAAPVVAAMDDGALAPTVLRAALDEAVLRRAPVLAVHYLRPGRDDADAAVQRARARLQGVVREVLHGPGAPAGVPVSVTVARDDPARGLLTTAATASLLVLGTRGPAALAGLAAQSVSRAVLDSAPVPVLLLVPRVARTSPRPHPDRRQQTPVT